MDTLVATGASWEATPSPAPARRPAGRPASRPHPTWDESPGFWLCTSGSTGQPKLAMHRQVDLLTPARGYAREMLDIGARRRVLLGRARLPCLRARELGRLSLLGGGGHGARAQPAADARRWWPTWSGGSGRRCSSASRPSTRPCWPPTSRRHVRLGRAWPCRRPSRCRPRSTNASWPALRRPDPRRHRLDRAGPHLHLQPAQPGGTRPGTSGRPVGGYRIRLVDEAGARCGRRRAGQLLVAGDSWPPATGAGPSRTGARSSANGCGPAICTAGRPTGSSPTWAGPTTCCASAANG